MPPDWKEILIDLVCQIIKAWDPNFDCETLLDDSAAVAELNSRYSTEGPPDLVKEEDILAFLKLLEDLVAHLDLPENSLSPTEDSDVRKTIADLRDDFGTP